MKCPFCGEDSFAKKKNIMGGWTLIKTVSVCALCGQELPEKELAEAEGKADARRAGLEALLGETLPDKVTLVLTSDREYCRNCRHFIEHPFCMRCGKNGCAVDPMGSCSGFEERH